MCIRDRQKALLDNDLYTIYALYDGIKLKAFISVWEFDKFAYVEHFAVSPEYRNGGLGAKMLKMCIRDRFTRTSSLPKVLTAKSVMALTSPESETFPLKRAA